MKEAILFMLMSMFLFTSCANNEKGGQLGNNENNEPIVSEEEQYVSELMTSSKDFEVETFAQELVGEWEIDSIFDYSDTWESIVTTHKFQGKWYSVGGGYVKYTFNADSKGLIYMENLGPNYPKEYGFNWHFDTENRVLVVSRGEDSFRYQACFQTGVY